MAVQSTRNTAFWGPLGGGCEVGKYHLKRVIGETILTYEEFATLLYQVEACMNSCPLTPLTEDTSELFVLTPAHHCNAGTECNS